MDPIRPALRKRLSCYSQIFPVLLLLTSAADARSKISPSDEYPGPWLEVSQEIREILTRNNVSACTQAAGRRSSKNPGEFPLYCTGDERAWTSWRVEPATRRLHGPDKRPEGILPPDSY